jgi:hypothetical protein
MLYNVNVYVAGRKTLAFPTIASGLNDAVVAIADKFYAQRIPVDSEVLIYHNREMKLRLDCCSAVLWHLMAAVDLDDDTADFEKGHSAAELAAMHPVAPVVAPVKAKRVRKPRAAKKVVAQ